MCLVIFDYITVLIKIHVFCIPYTHEVFAVLNRDMYHGIGALDPERLNVFQTVREITGRESVRISLKMIW